MKEIKGELRPLVIAGNEQHGNTRSDKIREGPNKRIKKFSRDVVLVKEVSAMNEKIGLHLNGVLRNSDKILIDGLSPILPSPGIGLGYLCDFKSKMRIGRMNKLQSAPTKT